MLRLIDISKDSELQQFCDIDYCCTVEYSIV